MVALDLLIVLGFLHHHHFVDTSLTSRGNGTNIQGNVVALTLSRRSHVHIQLVLFGFLVIHMVVGNLVVGMGHLVVRLKWRGIIGVVELCLIPELRNGPPSTLDRNGLGVTHCCCCLDHAQGVALLGVVFLVSSLANLVLGILWSLSLKDACYGPIYVPSDEGCRENLKNSTDLQIELMSISKYMQSYKLRYYLFLTLFVLINLITMATSWLLGYGAFKEKRTFLIPWMIMAKTWIFLLVVTTIYIIFLEARLFSVGTTVFGLFSLATLFLACLLAYFWVVVESLYVRLEQSEPEAHPRFAHMPNGHTNRAFENEESKKVPVLDTIDSGSIYPGDIPMHEISLDARDREWELYCRRNGGAQSE
eukprot:maker-scaffold90_size386344-snap-gene-1.21 protein:Tk12045 transcript:maker-scaffold90_size386344-snap-gene-1.21-mRNA-1 annotation:"hypothetical protein DAPPUDRAFT_310676"